MSFHLSRRSRHRLAGVHPFLVECVYRAIETTAQDFAVFEGLRDETTQAAYVARGVSKTMHSKHLLQPDGFAHAVDLVPFVRGRIDWCDDEKWRYEPIRHAMFRAAEQLGGGYELRWGGDWRWFDGPHFELR